MFYTVHDVTRLSSAYDCEINGYIASYYGVNNRIRYTSSIKLRKCVGEISNL